MTYMSLRRQDKKVNCGRVAQRAIKNLNNASGGGHIPAAGVHIMSKDWEIFRNRILKLL
jgi:nanoRNase/pAp phosphatase (c-di-AMP/oligoRNAs hydrolase)